MALPLRVLMLPVWLAIAPLALGTVDDAERSNTVIEEQDPNQAMNTIKLNLTINGRTATATLVDSATTRDFVSLLPLTLTLDDYANTEKISYLPRKLSTAGAPHGIDPSVGDITYYAPWGNLAIFHKDFGYSRGLISLGRLDTGIEAVRAPGKVEIRIEQAGSVP